MFCLCVEQEIEAMDADDILARQVEQLDKEKKELQIRLKTQEKKVQNTLSTISHSPAGHRKPPSQKKPSNWGIYTGVVKCLEYRTFDVFWKIVLRIGNQPLFVTSTLP